MTDEVTMKLGNIEIKPAQAAVQRFSMLLWGSAGCGKTTLASTAPGKKLWINFDPDGVASIADRDDVIVADFADQPDSCVERFKEPDPYKIGKLIEEHEIDTVVFDSMTSFGDKAMSHGVAMAKGTTKGRQSTLEDPGFAGYGNKNTWVRLCVKNMLAITAKHNANMIFIAHEDKPVTNDKGVVMFISIMLGSSLNEQIPVQISEVWGMTDTGKKRVIAIRPCRMRKPMKTRMFITNTEPEFEWKYDAETGEGDTLEGWYEQWKSNKFKKIPLPK